MPIPPWYKWYQSQLHVDDQNVDDDQADDDSGGYLRYPPATEDQLRATEEQIGVPLPLDLCHLYTGVANGGLELGPVSVFHGAIGGCGEYADVRPNGRTIEELASTSGWRLHPRIEEALLRHPGRYVVADATPEGFIWIAEDSDFAVEIDGMTGRVYYTEGWGYLPDAPHENKRGPFDLLAISAYAPSLSAWFARWLDEIPYRGQLAYHDDLGELLPEMVETDDLPDPEAVWRGLYRFGPDWRLWELPPDDGDYADNADDAI